MPSYPDIRGTKDTVESVNCLETFEERKLFSFTVQGFPTACWIHCCVLHHSEVLAGQSHCMMYLLVFISAHRHMTPRSEMQGLQVWLQQTCLPLDSESFSLHLTLGPSSAPSPPTPHPGTRKLDRPLHRIFPPCYFRD